MVHFNWTQFIPNVGHDYVHVATALVATMILLVLAIIGRATLGRGEAAVLPSGKLSVRAFFEAIIDFIGSLTEMVVGPEGRQFIPLFAGIFLYIFVNNLMGLLPGFTPATDNLNTTVAVGIFSFLAYNYYGLKEHGLAYLRHFLGPILAIAPLVLLIELISHFVRPLSLGLRLQGNMMGDHTVLGIALDLASYWFVPAIALGLGLFVCFMQAFVFTMLSMIYVSMAVSHDH